MPIPSSEKYPEDLVTLCKYLLYCCPKKALPVRGNMVTEVQKAIEEAGSPNNIKVWCVPTPQQRLILESARVVRFFGSVLRPDPALFNRTEPARRPVIRGL